MNKTMFALSCSLILLFTLSTNATFAQNSYRSICNQGLEFEKAGNLDAAVGKYTDAINSNPKLWEGYSYRAIAYRTEQKYDEALADILQAINLSPETKSLYEVRAECYVTKKMYDKAIQDLDFYLLAKPDDLRALFFQGLSYLKIGDVAKANKNALRIIELDPVKEVLFSGEHLLDIYDLELRRKTVKQSLDDANEYMEEEKTTASQALIQIKLNEAFQKLNNAWLNSSGIEKEDRDLQDIIRKDLFTVYSKMKDKPDIPEIARKYTVQATSATEDKRYQDAMTLWNKVLNISPYYALAYFNGALLSELSGNYRNSIEAMKRYLELYPDAPDARGAKDKIYAWEDKIQQLEIIVEKYTVANKLDKIADLSTIKINAKVLMVVPDPDGDVKFRRSNEIWMKNPDKIMKVEKVFGGSTISLFNGEKGYTILKGYSDPKPHEMSPENSSELLNENLFQNYMAKYLKNGQLFLAGEENINGSPAFKIRVKGENVQYIYIDKGSYLIVKSSTIVYNDGKLYPSDSYPSDYTEIKGVFLPMKTTSNTQYSKGTYTTTITCEKVEVNIPMEDDIFTVKGE